MTFAAILSFLTRYPRLTWAGVGVLLSLTLGWYGIHRFQAAVTAAEQRGGDRVYRAADSTAARVLQDSVAHYTVLLAESRKKRDTVIKTVYRAAKKFDAAVADLTPAAQKDSTVQNLITAGQELRQGTTTLIASTSLVDTLTIKRLRIDSLRLLLLGIRVEEQVKYIARLEKRPTRKQQIFTMLGGIGLGYAAGKLR
jgi:hypothetical protein